MPLAGTEPAKPVTGVIEFANPSTLRYQFEYVDGGILGTNYPDMQMISFGPNIRGAHSPDEKVQVSSVQKFWGYLMETLKRIPEKH